LCNHIGLLTYGHVRRQHMLLHIRNPETPQSPVRDLGRQLEASLSHGVLPGIHRALPTIFGEVGFCELGQ
jgi:hypothetical protein